MGLMRTVGIEYVCVIFVCSCTLKYLHMCVTLCAQLYLNMPPLLGMVAAGPLLKCVIVELTRVGQTVV